MDSLHLEKEKGYTRSLYCIHLFCNSNFIFSALVTKNIRVEMELDGLITINKTAT